MQKKNSNRDTAIIFFITFVMLTSTESSKAGGTADILNKGVT